MSSGLQRILGIDPGFDRMGYSVIEGKKDTWTALIYGCINTSSDESMPARLVQIADELNKLIVTYTPTICALEKLFFSKNVTTAIGVGQARGVVLLTAGQHKLEVREVTPLQVKQSITGYGRADKKQVQRMIALLLHLPSSNIQDDAADALAIALTASGLVCA